MVEQGQLFLVAWRKGQRPWTVR